MCGEVQDTYSSNQIMKEYETEESDFVQRHWLWALLIRNDIKKSKGHLTERGSKGSTKKHSTLMIEANVNH